MASADEPTANQTTAPWKTHPTLVFEGGTISIRRSGYGAENGSGVFTFDENDMEWHPHDDRCGSYVMVKVAKSEMEELRNWLTEQLKKVQDD